MDVTGACLLGASATAATLSSAMLVGLGRPRYGPRRLLATLESAWSWLLGAAPLRRARRTESRARLRSACLAELPVLLDVLTLGLSAGLSFDASLELYCSRSDGPLARAFSEAMLGWRIGIRSREEALWALADELGLSALRRFASVVGEALTFGSPLAEALERQAQVIRDEQRSQVEEEIERVPVKMLVPLGTLIVPAMFLAILGPLLGSVVAG